MRDPLLYPPYPSKETEKPMTLPKKTAAKKPAPKPPTPPTITGSDHAIVALIHHMGREHRYTKGEVQQKMGMLGNENFDRLWKETGL
jgi:hypothetical protein